MARTLSAELDVRRKDLLSVFPHDLIVDPIKRGREFPPTAEQVAELAADIRKQGQLQPVAVTITHDKRLSLEAGFTRYEAIMQLNAEGGEPRRIECKVIDGNAEELFLANISENRIRNITSDIDDAGNVRRLERDFSKSDLEIRAIYGSNGKAKPSEWLAKMRELLTLSMEQRLAIHLGQLSASAGLILASIAPEDREEVLAEAASTGEPVTARKLAKVAKSAGKLKAGPLQANQIESVWKYLSTNGDFEGTKIQKLAKIAIAWQHHKIEETDFLGALRKLFGEY